MEALTEKKYSQLKQAAADARREADQAAGAQKQLLKQLKDEFDCDTVKEAKTLLARLEGEEKAAKELLEKEIAAYEKEWDQE